MQVAQKLCTARVACCQTLSYCAALRDGFQNAFINTVPNSAIKSELTMTTTILCNRPIKLSVFTCCLFHVANECSRGHF